MERSQPSGATPLSPLQSRVVDASGRNASTDRGRVNADAGHDGARDGQRIRATTTATPRTIAIDPIGIHVSHSEKNKEKLPVMRLVAGVNRSRSAETGNASSALPVCQSRALDGYLSLSTPCHDDDTGKSGKLGDIRGHLPTAPTPRLAPFSASQLPPELRRRALLSA
jgi:hypothetical protein